MAQKLIRPLKNGSGMSVCSCPDELVGKGRCNHILEAANNTLTINYNREEKIYYVKIEDDMTTKASEAKAKIQAFVDSISQTHIEETTKNKIINFCKN